MTIEKEFQDKVNADISAIKTLVEDMGKKSITAEEKANIMGLIDNHDKSIKAVQEKFTKSLELPAEEKKEYSYFKAIKAVHEKKELTGIEGEFHKHAMKSLNIDTPANGGFLAPTLYQPGIDMAPKSSCPILDSVGISKINIMGGSSLQIAKEGDASTFSWVGSEEAGSEQQPTVGVINMTAKYYRSYGFVSNEAMKQTSADVNLEAFLRESLLNGQRKGLERALLRGTSANGQVKGVLNFSNILKNVTGGVPTFDMIDNMIAALEAVDTYEGRLAIVTHPSIAKILRQSKDDIGQYYLTRKTNAGISEFVGVPFYTSNNCTAVEGEYPIVLADWSKVILATFGAVELKVNEQAFTPWSKNQIVVGLFGTADVAITRENAVVAITDATLVN